MCKTIVLLSFCVLFSLILDEISADEKNDKIKVHQAKEHEAHQHNTHQKSQKIHHKKQEHHHETHRGREHHHFHHSLTLNHHGKRLKGRDNNQSTCSWICADQQLLGVIALFNGTKELQLLYKYVILPLNITTGNNSTNSSVCNYNINNNSTNNNLTNNNSTNNNSSNNSTINFRDNNATIISTIKNCTNASVINNPLRNSTEEFPILSYLFNKFFDLLSDSRGISFLFKQHTEFAVAWRDVIRSVNGSNRTNVIAKNLNTLLGGNGTFGENFFNLNYTESLISNISSGGILNNIQQGIQSFFNSSNFYKGHPAHHHRSN